MSMKPWNVPRADGLSAEGADYCSYCSVCTQKSIWEEAQKVLAEFLEESPSTISPTGRIEGTISRKSAEGGLREPIWGSECWK
jgi:hypothetical protein